MVLKMENSNFEQEIWRPIEGYEGFYEVSNLGRVKSLARITAHGRKIKEKQRKLPLNKGYPTIKFSKDGEWELAYVHRIVAKVFIPNPENKREVNHIDGNKLNNKVENLEWVTSSENVKHAYDSGLHTRTNVKGEYNNKAILTEKQVKEIKLLILDGRQNRELAAMYNVSRKVICDIKKGRNWKHVQIN